MALTVSGKQLLIGSAPAVTVGPSGTTVVAGPFQGYTVSPYQLYLGMFGLNFTPSGHVPTTAQCNAFVNTGTFPAGTTLTWNTIPSSTFNAINGYLNIAYGNYDGGSVSITPKQIKNITTLTANVGWTYTGSAQDLLCECFLTTTSHASGTLTDSIFEIGFLVKNSSASETFTNGLTPVGTGSFTDVNGVIWVVGQGTSGAGSFPFVVASRVGYSDHYGALDFKSLFSFLTTSGVTTGNEWMNGLAFGVETLLGEGSLTYNSFTVTYS